MNYVITFLQSLEMKGATLLLSIYYSSYTLSSVKMILDESICIKLSW